MNADSHTVLHAKSQLAKNKYLTDQLHYNSEGILQKNKKSPNV